MRLLTFKFILARIRLRRRRRLLRHSTTSFGANVVVAETSYQMLEFYHFAIGRGLNLLSSIKITVPSFPGLLLFENTRKNRKSNLVLESKGL